MASNGKSMLETLNEEPKVTIRIPMPENVSEDTELVVTVAVNGVSMRIAKGDTVEVPISIYEVLKRSGRVDLV